MREIGPVSSVDGDYADLEWSEEAGDEDLQLLHVLLLRLHHAEHQAKHHIQVMFYRDYGTRLGMLLSWK